MKVSVICGDSFLLAGIVALLGEVSGVEAIRTSGAAEETFALIRDGSVDAALLCSDALTPEEFGELSRLKAERNLAILAVSGFSDLATGVVDELVPRQKGLTGLRTALDSLRRQPARRSSVPKKARHQLTRREREIAHLVASGKSNRQIAQALGLREQSIKNVVSVVMRKLKCENRVQVALQFAAEPTKIAG